MDELRKQIISALEQQAHGAEKPEFPQAAKDPRVPPETRAKLLQEYAGGLLQVPTSQWTAEDVALVRGQVAGVLGQMGR